ncbi:hypothetical protein [Streptomyces sp. NPDC007264]|uniref:hypothetical protein n=1 Tax=Streptomyces sp. NPDC007264 TaxID=3364777 RepID=UPI0036DF4564
MTTVTTATASSPDTADQRNPNETRRDKAREAFPRVWDAIEAMFAVSENAEMTRGALRELVDMCAAKARQERVQAQTGVTA